jgi:hypothetical protein
MTYLQTIASRKLLIAGDLLPGKGGYPLPGKPEAMQLPTACVSHASFTLALDRNDG